MEAPDWRDFLSAVLDVHHEFQDEIIRYTLIQAGGRWSDQPVHSEARILKLPLKNDYPVELRLWSDFDPLPADDWVRTLKSGSRIAYQLGYDNAVAQGFHDVLLIGAKQQILETSTGNVFFLHKGNWITPPIALGLLPGVARAWVLESGLAREAVLGIGQLDEVSAVAMSNSVRGLVPVAAIGERIYDTAPAIELAERLGPREFDYL